MSYQNCVCVFNKLMTDKFKLIYFKGFGFYKKTVYFSFTIGKRITATCFWSKYEN